MAGRSLQPAIPNATANVGKGLQRRNYTAVRVNHRRSGYVYQRFLWNVGDFDQRLWKTALFPQVDRVLGGGVDSARCHYR